MDERDRKFYYKNILLSNFSAAKDSAKVIKGSLLGRMKEAMQTRLEAAENRFVLMATTILNCKGWERKGTDEEEDEEFTDIKFCWLPSKTSFVNPC